MNNIFERGLKLFEGIIYESINRYPTFIHIKSVFRDEWYNFIVPTVEPSQLDWSKVKSIISSEKEKGISMSYYVPDQYYEQYSRYFTSKEIQENISSDLYICKHVDEEYEPIGELILLDDSNIDQYTSMSEKCFPEWANNVEYADHMYDHQKNNKDQIVYNYLLRHDNKYVGFCGFIGLAGENLAYFHNTGVMHEYRRKGYFNSMIKHLLNKAKSLNITDVYALVEQDSGSYHGLTKLGFIVNAKYHLFSTH